MSLSRWLCLIVALCVAVRFVRAQVKPLFVDCGSDFPTKADGRVWVGDSVPGNNLSLSYHGSVVKSSEIKGESTYKSLYRTTRIFNMTSNYTFGVPAGFYFMRLHFYPFSFGDISANQSTFGVTANNLRLLADYNVPDEIASKNSYYNRLTSNLTLSSLLKEYFINISTDSLWLEFSPSPGSYAFVNAIEIIPVADKGFFNSTTKVGDNGKRSFLNLIDRGMETMYRLNVEGPKIEPKQDQDLWRKWEQDGIYMLFENTGSKTNSSGIRYANRNHSSVAPLTVYTTARVTLDSNVLQNTFNMSWKFNVDPNFDYIVRLHFCELSYNGTRQRLFSIYIDSKVAAKSYDVFAKAGGENKAYHEDYIVSFSKEVSVLWLQLGSNPSISASHTNSILNGLEIFKISRNDNLAYVSKKLNTGDKGLQRHDMKFMIIFVALGAAFFSVCVFFALYCIWTKKKKRETTKVVTPTWRPLVLYDNGSTSNAHDSRPINLVNGSGPPTIKTGRRFTIVEIRAATKNFDESLVIGTGGFGKVYKGEIEEGTPVAVKRAHPNSEQGLREFETEIEMLSKLRHHHLVSMIGYCDEQREMILVYEYMANGTLRNHLFGSDLPPLSWKQRLDACVGAARGLHYLHTGAERGIIHRDVKTTNILLDENLVAKMADFGLSKTGPALDHTHVSTAVKGSFGYLDPEYFRRQKLTKKSDVYSFGVVLFEVACARPVINPTLPKEQINLAEWAVKCQRQGHLEDIVDPRLEKNYSLVSLVKFGEIAEKCLADEGTNRPTMGEVLCHLENVVRLHDEYAEGIDGDSPLKHELRSVSVSQGLALIKEEEENACPAKGKLEESSLLSMDSLGHSSLS